MNHAYRIKDGKVFFDDTETIPVKKDKKHTLSEKEENSGLSRSAIPLIILTLLLIFSLIFSVRYVTDHEDDVVNGDLADAVYTAAAALTGNPFGNKSDEDAKAEENNTGKDRIKEAAERYIAEHNAYRP